MSAWWLLVAYIAGVLTGPLVFLVAMVVLGLMRPALWWSR
ncbi:hypothetical protein GCM10028796_46960 [Ramlibacter monticola]